MSRVVQGDHQEKDISLRKHVGLVPDLSIDFKKLRFGSLARMWAF
jgi:hypothetical protein